MTRVRSEVVAGVQDIIPGSVAGYEEGKEGQTIHRRAEKKTGRRIHPSKRPEGAKKVRC